MGNRESGTASTSVRVQSPDSPFPTPDSPLHMATLVQAVRLALHYAETHLGVTDVFGEDVGPPLGGVFTATQG